MSIETATDIGDFLELSEQFPVIDVRSPGEFAHGHIPGAFNVPLLNDEQRAAVGTTYKQNGREAAVALGFELVNPRKGEIVEAVRDVCQDQDVLVHCWRGGMRSDGVAKLLNENGFRAQRLHGGYKAYRGASRDCFAGCRRVVILTGLSGAGKTQVLWALREAGEQVIDLEGMANHRGSAFGGISQPPQPTQEQFENNLFQQWRALDPTRVVWIESESQAIGNLRVPAGIWPQMTNAPAVYLDVARERRVDFLMEQYGDLPLDALAASMDAIKKRLGGERHREAIESLENGDLRAFASEALEYYDKAYNNAKKTKWSQKNIATLTAEVAGQLDLVPQLRDLGLKLTSSA